MFFLACDICNPVSIVRLFRICIQNACTTACKFNQLRNENTLRWESRNITTQQGEIHDRESEIIAFVVQAGMKFTANNFFI